MKNNLLIYLIILILSFSFRTSWAQNENEEGDEGYEGNSNIQFLYGKSLFPENPDLATITLEHFGNYGAFEHFGFTDIMDYSDGYFDLYSEYYPRFSLSDITNTNLRVGPLKEVFIGGGINALWRNIDQFFVVLAGPLLTFEVPGFNLFQLETYYYRQIGFQGSFQVTYVWDAPISLNERYKFRTRGFIDYIGPYNSLNQNDSFSTQILAQPQLLLDFGNLWGSPGKGFVGTEYRYWYNYTGTPGRVESILQLVFFFPF